jgi:glycosyltransferase involved in cell wall biosynthesis
MADLRVSVALCSYQGEEFIQQQLESILRQSRPIDELIVSDDLSTDRTVDIVREVIRGHQGPVQHTVCVNRERLGIRKNCEAALARTTGDIIFLSDQDDVWADTRVEAMLARFRRDPAVCLAYANAVITDSALRPSNTFLWPGVHRELDTRSAVRRIGICSCAMAFRASLKAFVIPIPVTWWHDHWIACGAFALGKVDCIPMPLMYYRRHSRAWYADGLPISRGKPTPRWRLALDDIRRLPRMIRDMNANHDVSAKHRRDLLQRLETLRGRESNFPKLDATIDQLRDNLAFIGEREGLMKLGLVGRCRTAYRLSRKGDYRRYASGTLSALRDAVLPSVWRRRA